MISANHQKQVSAAEREKLFSPTDSKEISTAQLLRYLKDPQFDAQAMALRWLTERQECVMTVLIYIGEQPCGERSRLMHMLTNYSAKKADEIVPPILAHLQEVSNELAATNEPTFVDALRSDAKAAILVLSHFGGQQALAELRNLTGHADGCIAASAKLVFSSLGPKA